jgi:hypothetical protein
LDWAHKAQCRDYRLEITFETMLNRSRSLFLIFFPFDIHKRTWQGGDEGKIHERQLFKFLLRFEIFRKKIWIKIILLKLFLWVFGVAGR